eukprot:GFUD01036708.1.p1 GENE.GFUD01036708.1~~GFUD01036708.1.p1  ORF type:complete len:168 (-),score=35.53 GFUD01036708.1:83-586(-)
MSDEHYCGLLTLPSEVFAHIGPFLSPHSVCQLELTSRVARQAVEMANVWRTMVEEIKTWLTHIYEHEETVGADGAVVKKWEVEVIPIMSDHGHETDQVLAKIFVEGIKDVERKVGDLEDFKEFALWFLGISFSVLQEENIVAVYLTKIPDDNESRSFVEWFRYCGGD